MERISAVTVHCSSELGSAAGVQRLKVFQEVGRQFADLAARNNDAEPLRQPAEDLFPLSMVEEALDSNMNLQVIAIHLAWGYFKHEGFGPSCHQFSRRLSTAGFADEHGLVGDEIAVLQRDDPMRGRLLDFG